MRKYIEGLAKGYGNSLIIVSQAGLGKTETTIETLKQLNYVAGVNYTYLSNYITPIELFKTLHSVNKLKEPKILILDDVEDTLRNPRAIGLLKGALWAVNGHRKVMWWSGTHLLKEKQFEFTGRIIFLLNSFNRRNPILNALKDRGYYYEMKFNNGEMLKLMEEKAKLPYQNIPLNKRKEIVFYLQKIANNSPNITLRLLPKAYQLFQLSPNHYKHLIKELI